MCERCAGRGERASVKGIRDERASDRHTRSVLLSWFHALLVLFELLIRGKGVK